MTAQDLSEKSGINLSTIKKYETDGRNPKLEQLQKIADALEVSIFEFLDIEIKSVSDILSLLNKMNESTSMNWMIDDETGTANISFNINEINKSLCDYTLFNNNESLIIEENKKQYSSFVKKLIMNNGKIK